MSRRVVLFGGLEVRSGGLRSEMDSARVESLLAHLALHREAPVPRARLAALLWPDTSDAQARTNLRKVLHLLRRALPDVEDLLQLTGATIRWRPDTTWSLDVAEFDELIGDRRWDEAVALYRGDLLPGCQDPWLEPVRISYRARFLDALRELAAAQAAAGSREQAVATASRALDVERTDEVTARLLMRLHDSGGDRARAVRVFHGLVVALRDDLGIGPEAETLRLRDALLVGDDQETSVPGPAAPPFVGRVPERRQLVDAWRTAESGWSSAVLVTGETGIGKTRLVEDFVRWCAHQGVPGISSQAYAAEGVLAYGPVTEWLGTLALRRRISALPPHQVGELARLRPELASGLGTPPAVSEEEGRRRLWSAVTAALVGAGDPLLLVLDDAQWADHESLRLVHHLLRTARDAPLLVVLTARSDLMVDAAALREVVRGLRTMDRLTELELTPLSATETRMLTGPETTDDTLWELTGGNPLFAVEALRSGWPVESGLTTRVQEVIERRLAAVGPTAREVFSAAAVLDSDFDVDLVAALVGTDPVLAIDELWRHGLVRARGASTYEVAHEQLRLAAGSSMSPVVRRRLHERAAAALVGSGGAAARIARHLDEADAVDEAAQWYATAAAEAQRLGAAREAVHALERSRELLLRLDESPERHRRELAVLSALPAPLAAVEGYASTRLRAAHDRALDVAAQAGAELDGPLLWSLAFAALVAEDFATARHWAGELHRRGLQLPDHRLVVEGACLLGIASFWSGDLAAADSWFATTLAEFAPEDRDHHIATYGQDPQVVALARTALIRALLGDGVAAATVGDQARRAAEEAQHPLSRAASAVFDGLLGVELGDEPRIRAAASTLAVVHPGARPVQLAGEALAGLVEVLDGQVAPGVEKIRAVVARAAIDPAAPGMVALLHRILLQAAHEAQDRDLEAATASWLRDQGGAAVVWRHTAERHLLG